MSARLYVIPGSHPSFTARLMLERKRLEYERVDLMPMIAKPVLRALRFPKATVPALTVDGRRIQGTRAIARALDELRPDPPLLPAEVGARRAVYEAERWGDEVFQGSPRRIVWWALRRDRSSLASFSVGARLGIPVGLAVKTAAPIVWASARYNHASDEAVRADLAALPEMLDRVDEWIEEGVLGGEEPNAADYQIATSLRLLMSMEDIRPAIEGRPCGALARRVVPDFPGHIGPVFPREWLEPLIASRVR